jgi:hypothetical protein
MPILVSGVILRALALNDANNTIDTSAVLAPNANGMLVPKFCHKMPIN